MLIIGIIIFLGECVGSLTAHQDAVSCLSIDASGLYVASGGTDNSHARLSSQTNCNLPVLARPRWFASYLVGG